MKMKNIAAALIAVALLLTGCSGAGTAAKADSGENSGDNEESTAVQWTEEKLNATFLRNNEAEEILASVPAEDGAYELVGVVMYTENESEYIYLGFMDGDGYCQCCGLEAEAYKPSELEYLGDGKVSFSFLDKSGELKNCILSFSREGSDVLFKAESSSPDNKKGL